MKASSATTGKLGELIREWLFALLMGLIMVSTISFANVILRQGFSNGLWSHWMISLLIGLPISVPLILILPKRVRKLVSKIPIPGQERSTERN